MRPSLIVAVLLLLATPTWEQDDTDFQDPSAGPSRTPLPTILPRDGSPRTGWTP